MFERAAALGLVFSLGLAAAYLMPGVTTTDASLQKRPLVDMKEAVRWVFFSPVLARADEGRDSPGSATSQPLYLRPPAPATEESERFSAGTVGQDPGASQPDTTPPEPEGLEDPGADAIVQDAQVEDGLAEVDEGGEAETDESEADVSPPGREASDRSGAAEETFRVRLGISPARTGLATYYHPSLRGLPMANGMPYDPSAMTAASNTWPLGTLLRVTYQESIIVEVTDRGAFRHALDLSSGAFRTLAGNLAPGVIRVTIEELEPE